MNWGEVLKNKYLIGTIVILLYSLIGHVFNIEILKVVTISKDEFRIGILGVVICIFTLYCISRFCKIDFKK